MATSQQWPHASHLLMMAVTLAVLFIGSADARKTYNCKPGFKDCNPRKPGCETDIWTDEKNCGACRKECKQPKNAISNCIHGKCCEPFCKPGYADCDNKIWKNGCEINTDKDAKNCGACGHECDQVANAVTKCLGGKCCDPVCKPGFANCDGDWSNGCETCLTFDIFNCGSCGNKCPCSLLGGEPTCRNGDCGEQCKRGTRYDKNKKCCVPIH